MSEGAHLAAGRADGGRVPGAPGDGPLVLGDLDLAALAAAVRPHGVGLDVARRIFARVHREGGTDIEGVRGLGRAAAASLARVLEWPRLEVVERRASDDGFVKYLFRTPDGHLVEAVRIPLPDADAARALRVRRRTEGLSGLQPLAVAKYTVCISSQVGCALACAFCATGRLGGVRSLRPWEMLAQVAAVADEAEHAVRGVVFMGMGEPFLNYEAVMRSIDVLSAPAGRAIAARAITISTAGVVPAIRRFTDAQSRARLIVSLGSPFPEERRRLMPIEERWPLGDLMAALHGYARSTTQRLTFAYVAIGGPGGNVTAGHAEALGRLVAGLKARVNLIDVDDAAGGHPRPTEAELAVFRDALAPLGVPVVRRYSGGSPIGASCGNLARRREGELVAIGRGRE